MIDPQQELFIAIRQALVEEYGAIVYDGFLPAKGTPYPFIYLADSQIIDEQNKSGVCGRVVQMIHVYNNTPKKRGSMSSMLATIKSILRHIESTKHFGWMVIGLDQQIMPDNTAETPLMHGIITVTYKFS